MNSMDILSPYEPPHMDSITSLSILNNRLISGSKDKNLKLWSLTEQPSVNSGQNNSRVKNSSALHTFPAFNDYITSCETDSNS